MRPKIIEKTYRGASIGANNPTFIYISTQVKNNVNRVFDRLLRSAAIVKPDHLIIRILHSVGLSNSNLSALELHYAVSERLYDIAQMLGITTATSIGRAHTNVCGGTTSVSNKSPTTELVLAHCDESWLTDSSDWAHMSPIRILYHTHSNLSPIMLGKDGVYLLSLNFPQLVWQYVCWSKAVRASGRPESIQHFVAKYVLGNAIRSYNDVALFNQLLYPLTNTELTVDTAKFVVPVTPIAKLDHWLDYVQTTLDKTRLTISGVLSSVPLVYGGTALDLTQQPKTLVNKQNDWLLQIAAMPYIQYGALSCKRSGSVISNSNINSYLRQLDNLMGSSWLSRMPPALTKIIVDRFYTPTYELLE